MKGDRSLTRREIGNTYVGEADRFIVSLVVGYTAEELAAAGYEATPMNAAECARNLTCDENAGDTHWYVFDRQTGVMTQLEQRQFDSDFWTDDHDA